MLIKFLLKNNNHHLSKRSPCARCWAKNLTNIRPFVANNGQGVPFTKERTELHKGKVLANSLIPGVDVAELGYEVTNFS